VDGESTEAVYAFQFLEAVERHFAGPGDELQQLSTLFLTIRMDSSPEPLDLWRSTSVVVVFSVTLPVVDINFR
jgi:hypothetical protein